MSKILIALAFVGLLFAIITAIPWPDITVMTAALAAIIQYTFTFNTVLPIDTAWSLSMLVMGIEVGLFSYRLISKIISFITGHNAPYQASVGSTGICNTHHGKTPPGL